VVADSRSGVVLYGAFILLVLPALIGTTGMQLAGTQDRMAAKDLRRNVAFQAAEREVRVSETGIESALYTSGTYTADQEVCEPTFDPVTWADEAGEGDSTHVRRVDKCFPASSVVVGGVVSEDTGNIYEISAISSDLPDAPGASAVINTIFIP